jgi:hypothetical protein
MQVPDGPQPVAGQSAWTSTTLLYDERSKSALHHTTRRLLLATVDDDESILIFYKVLEVSRLLAASARGTVRVLW